MTITSRAVQDGVNDQRFTDDGEEYPKRKTLGQHTPHPIAWSKNAKVIGMFLRPVNRFDDLICQFQAQAGPLLFIPSRRLDNIFCGERTNRNRQFH